MEQDREHAAARSAEDDQTQQPDSTSASQTTPQEPVHWIDFQRNEVEDSAYTPAKDNVRGAYLPDQVDQVNRAAHDDDFNSKDVGGLAEGGGTYGAVGAGTSGGTMGRGDTGELGVMAGTDLSDTLGGPGAPDRTAGPEGSEPLGDIDEPEVRREAGTEPTDR
ncbi:MAG TPA: hypothetical protein VF120_18150 [Ktedonobacterales bacterium]